MARKVGRIGPKAVILVSVLVGLGMILFQARRFVFPRVSHDDVLNNARFEFRYEDRNWESGLTTTFSVDAAGHVEYRPERVMQVHQNGGGVAMSRGLGDVRFTAPTEHVRLLREAVADNQFFDLDDSYVDRSIHDGANATFSARVGEHTKSVHCSNLFPPEIIAIRNVIRAHLLTPPR